jgi:hypothetical protein
MAKGGLKLWLQVPGLHTGCPRLAGRWLDMAFENGHVQGPVQINDEKYVIPYDLKIT